MTNQEILTKAIEKAIDGGWKLSTNRFDEELNTPEYIVKMVFEPCCDEDRLHLANIIFNHDFAKALWGDDEVCIRCWNQEPPHREHLGHTEYWKLQLMRMVIADDPIKYLGEHI